MKTPSYPALQRMHGRRRPSWRWDRANELIQEGMYLSRRRDDEPTRIAVSFLRELGKCLTESRLKRVTERYRYLARAHEIWQTAGAVRLQIECRVLARQTNTEIGLAMNLPPETVQAYEDLFFNVRDKINASSYITFEVVGVDPTRPPTPVQLMKLCCYHHGPFMVEPWLDYLSNPDAERDVTTEAGRTAASIELLITVHHLPSDPPTIFSILKRYPFILEMGSKSDASVTAQSAFRGSTERVIADLGLETAELGPCSYAPNAQPEPKQPRKRQTGKAA